MPLPELNKKEKEKWPTLPTFFYKGGGQTILDDDDQGRIYKLFQGDSTR